jgi:pimeloyl-ACP methyl ester carboxylesterase
MPSGVGYPGELGALPGGGLQLAFVGQEGVGAAFEFLALARRNSEQIIAEDSTHNIQYDDPELVIDAIRQVMEEVRNGGSV